MAAPPPVVLLMGPTASGKSAAAMMLAQRFDGEIVGVDSAQVYRGMDIGTAKPSARERAHVPHHLIDIADPIERYSAARFVADARAAIAGIRARGKLPILAGGTMLYFKALREGLSALPQADALLRAELDAKAARLGWPAMHAELARVDPVTARRLQPMDAQRIQRALEVWTLAGVPLSELQGHRASGASLGPVVSIALVPSDRARLHQAIAQRLDAMLAAGLLDELSQLRRHHALSPDLPSMRCVGYRQAWEFQDGLIDAATMRLRALAATRQLAKRQYTWLRATEAVQVDPYAGNIAARVASIVEAAH
jgi:tRNA dimethylallyltransferase